MDLEALLEAEKRGILPAEMASVLAEARNRGLVPQLDGAAPEAPAAAQVPERDSTGYQAMSGFNEGLAGTLGFPVDAVTAGLNLIPGVDIQNPALGSQSIRNMMGSAISENEPDGAGQRFARSIGREAGAMAVPGLGMAAKAERPARMLALDAASSVGAGTAGQAVSEVAPDAVLPRMIAEMIGGGAPIAASQMASRGPQAPTRDELVARQEAAYADVDQSPARLPEGNSLVDEVQGAASMTGVDRYLHPKAARTMQRIGELPSSPSVAEVDRARRLISRDVMGAAEPGEQAIGGAMRQALDDYLSRHAQSGEASPALQETLDRLHEGRDMTRRIKADEAIDEATMRGERRAATSGVGGNEVNAIRQNIRGILDSPTKSRGFSDAEKEAMEEIVRGTPTINAARMLGRFAPTSGALPAMGGMGVAAINPGVAFAGAGAAQLGKWGAEELTQRQIRDLSEQIRNGGPVAAKEATDTVKRSIASLLASQVAGQPG